MYRALHNLLADGRDPLHPVCLSEHQFMYWREFSSLVLAHGAGFAAHPAKRWLLPEVDPCRFVAILLGLLHAGKQVVIPPNWLPGTLERLSDSFEMMADEHPLAASSQGPLVPIDPHAATIDIYTSGSTGEPKRIRKTLAQFESEIEVLESLWGAALGDAAVIASVPHHHFYGLLFRLFWPLSAGRLFDTATCADPARLGERLARLDDAALVSSPALLTRLSGLVPLSTLCPAPRLVFSSGGPLSGATAEEFRVQFGESPTEVFGSTETGGIAWRRQLPNDDLWMPMPGVSVAREEDGALSLRSSFLPSDKPWRMDDAVELGQDGRFRLCGRLDRTVKVEGKRLSLPEMERCLALHPWVTSAATILLPGKRQVIGAIVTLNITGREQRERSGRRYISLELRRHLAQHFEAVVLPRRWCFVDQLPMDERGKLTYAALSGLFAQTNGGQFIP